jgi:hypothetical protein
MYWRSTNALQFYWCTFIVLMLPTCFGHSCGSLQGDFFENNKKIVITMCLNHSTVLQLELRFKKHICYITSNNPQLADTVHILHNVHKYGPMETAINLLHSGHTHTHTNELLRKLLYSSLSPTQHHY